MNKTDQSLSTSTLAAYGTLAFPLAAGFIALQVIVPTYYAQVLGLSLSAVGGILLAARLWDMVTDPLVGFLSDRTPVRLGRRRIWILASAPLILLFVWLLFNPQPGVGNTYLTLTAIGLYVAGTMAIVPMNAWGAELSPLYHDRSRVSGARVVFGLAGTLCALLLVDNSSNEGLRDSLYAITILVFVSLFIAVPTLCRWVPDRADFNHSGSSLRGALSLLSKPSPFRRLLLAFMLNGYANAIPATLFLLFMTHVLEEPGLAGPILFAYFLCSAISVPFWLWVSRRLGKHQAWCIAVFGSCLFFSGAPFLAVGDTGWYIFIVVGTGLMIGADLSLPHAINSDLIEWDALENKTRRPALFFALWGTASKLSYALAVGTIFPFLDWIGFDATTTNSVDNVAWLALLYGGPSILLKLVAMALMWNFPIGEKEHDAIREKLAAV